MRFIMMDQMWNHILGHLTLFGRTHGYGPNCHNYRRGRFIDFPSCSSRLSLPRLLQKVSILDIKQTFQSSFLTSQFENYHQTMKRLDKVFSLGDPAATTVQANETTSRVCKNATKKVGFKEDIQDIKSDKNVYLSNLNSECHTHTMYV